jgi:hypothetical protein
MIEHGALGMIMIRSLMRNLLARLITLLTKQPELRKFRRRMLC